MVKTTAVTFKLPVWIQTGLRQLAFYKNTTQQSIVADAIADVLKSEGINPPDEVWGANIKANIEVLKKTGISTERLNILAKCNDLPSQEEKDKINSILEKRPTKPKR